MKPIAVFYHCLFGLDGQLLPNAFNTVHAHMNSAYSLLQAASHIVIGVNGGPEDEGLASLCFPANAQVIYHGAQCRNENRTIAQIERWLAGHEDWLVCYFHSKGATHPPGDLMRENWNRCMTRHVVENWPRCVADLEAGFDSAGCHWLTGQSQHRNQNLWAGNFWWARADYLRTLPSIFSRDRIKVSGIDSLESRFEAEVWIGNGPRLPRVRDYHPKHPMTLTCR